MSENLKDTKFPHQKDTLIIKSNVINVFRKYEQRADKNESGGILLGNVYSDHSEIVKVTTPNIFDKFGKYFFVRSKTGAQPQINRDWKKTEGILIYLGEWHTHSEINPKPSNEDKRMIKKALMETTMEIDFLYIVIVGQFDTYWAGKQTKGSLIELKFKCDDKDLILHLSNHKHDQI